MRTKITFDSLVEYLGLVAETLASIRIDASTSSQNQITTYFLLDIQRRLRVDSSAFPQRAGMLDELLAVHRVFESRVLKER